MTAIILLGMHLNTLQWFIAVNTLIVLFTSTVVVVLIYVTSSFSHWRQLLELWSYITFSNVATMLLWLLIDIEIIFIFFNCFWVNSALVPSLVLALFCRHRSFNSFQQVPINVMDLLIWSMISWGSASSNSDVNLLSPALLIIPTISVTTLLISSRPWLIFSKTDLILFSFLADFDRLFPPLCGVVVAASGPSVLST